MGNNHMLPPRPVPGTSSGLADLAAAVVSSAAALETKQQDQRLNSYYLHPKQTSVPGSDRPQYTSAYSSPLAWPHPHHRSSATSFLPQSHDNSAELAPIQPKDCVAEDNRTLPPLHALTAAAEAAAAALPLYTPSPPPHATYRRQSSILSTSTNTSELHTNSSRNPQPAQASSPHWPSLNPLSAYYASSHAVSAEASQRMELDPAERGTLATYGATSPGRWTEGESLGQLDLDEDMRIAAETLGRMRTDTDSSFSPSQRSVTMPPGDTPLPSTAPLPSPHPQPLAAISGAVRPTSLPPPIVQDAQPHAGDPEPLLTLLTSQYPVVGTVVDRAMNTTQVIYDAGKNHVPLFKVSAELAEYYGGRVGGYVVPPIASTVESVGRKTGVEGSVRWLLCRNRRHNSQDLTDLDSTGPGSKKRRRVAEDMGFPDGDERKMDGRSPYAFRDRRLSSVSNVSTLPPYDEFRSPAYTASDARASPSSAWQSRLMISTSGLGVAMREESLTRLKYCLTWLRWANKHIDHIIQSMKEALDSYEKPGTASAAVHETTPHESLEEEKQRIASTIDRLSNDVLKTLKNVVRTVSDYAGNALPENAKELVRSYLNSLPRRFFLAEHDSRRRSGSDGAEGSQSQAPVRDRANSVLLLAKEALDVLENVTGVVDGTIVSAEMWVERMTRGRNRQKKMEEGLLEERGCQGDEKEKVTDGQEDVVMS